VNLTSFRNNFNGGEFKFGEQQEEEPDGLPTILEKSTVE
jgi:hypothetical protein